MKTRLLKLITFITCSLLFGKQITNAQTVATFENLMLTSTMENLSLSPNSYWNGAALPIKETFMSADAIFQNEHNGYWSGGFAYSNVKDSTTAGFTNMYAARPATGYNNSSNYAIGQNGSVLNLVTNAIGKTPKGFYITNSTYAAISMRDGDNFAKKFGGVSGNDPDWFKLTIRKWLGGVMTNDSVEFYLADYRSSNNAQDYIVKTWQWVDLSSLGNVDSLQFNLSSSDVGAFGMNTPGFFCIDNFVVNHYWNGSVSSAVKETFTDGNGIFQNEYSGYWSGGFAYSDVQDSTTAGFTNMYAAIPAIGYNNSANYAVGQNGAVINLNSNAIGKVVNGFYVTNSTYAAISMRDGDTFAKKFGGVSGNDPDWFKLTVKKWLGGVMTNDSVEFYLADFRSSNNSQDYIVTTWQWVDLSSLGNVDSLQFNLSSSDVGSFGMNTPAFFCMDNFTTADLALAINESMASNDLISVYPNPVKDLINIDISKITSSVMMVNVFDVSGKLVYSEKTTPAMLLNIDMSSYRSGVYFINIVGDTINSNKKIIKE